MNDSIKSVPVVIAAIASVTILEVYALYQGMNGVILTLVIGAICALAGTKIGQVLEHRSIAKNDDKV